MFRNLTGHITQAFRELTGRDKLTEAMIDQGCTKIETALLEADVADAVIDSILNHYRNKILNTPVPPQANQGDFLIKLFHDELTRILGQNDDFDLHCHHPQSCIMLVGLQGAGKTTFAAKLAKHLMQAKKQRILLCSVDTYRPAAIDQLKLLAQQCQIDFFHNTHSQPLAIARAAKAHAQAENYDLLIVDTAGRTSIDDHMMQECHDIARTIQPQELLFVLDSTTGQDAANTAKVFHERLSLTGAILTKVDSDTRGGAALSVRHIVGKPIKLLSTGEKIDDIDEFSPERIAGQILGMGDIVSLMKQMEGRVNKEKNIALMKKVSGQGQFDFNDFKSQFEQIKSMGGMQSILEKLPMMAPMMDKLQSQFDESQFEDFVHLIDSMTSVERAQPFLVINKDSRQKRIVKGSGKKPEDLKKLLKHYQKMQKSLAKMKGKKFTQAMSQMQDMFKNNPDGML